MEPVKTTRSGIDRLDIHIVIAMGICLLSSHFIPFFQVMTACIAVLLCMQDSLKVSWKAGVTRMIITAIGGLVGIAVILADMRIGNDWIFLALFMLGALLTLLACKLAKVPYISARIGGVTFVLVVLTKTGADRILYAVIRLGCTFYGVAVVLAVAAVSAWIGRSASELRNRNRNTARTNGPT